MFASRNHNQANQLEGKSPERSDSAPDRKNAHEQNPLWQSLAMRSGIVQPKLTVGHADDPYEREADRIADQVMRMPSPHSSGHGLSITPVTAHQAQRKCAECEEEEEEGKLQRKESSGAEAPATAPPIVDQTLCWPGQPLDAATRAYFEPRFGHDFSGVRIHTGGDAVSATHAVHARAFTEGNRIAFGERQYAPHSETGRRLLAHELTHTLQQRRASSTMLQRQELPEPLDPIIAQAQAAAVAAIGRAAERLSNAIEARSKGLPMPGDTAYALDRFFPGIGIMYGSLEDLLGRVEPMAQWLPEIPARTILLPIFPNRLLKNQVL
jgi:hypothetical protein